LEARIPGKFDFDNPRFPDINSLKAHQDQLISTVYSDIYEKIIDLENSKWHTIFEIVKDNKAKNIHATIIDFPILEQNLNLQTEKLLDYSKDRVDDMSLMKYMVHDTKDKIICSDISQTGQIVAIGFEDGLIKIFKHKISSSASGSKRTRGIVRSYSERSMGTDLKDEDVKESTDNLIGHKGAVFCLSISDDEKLLISGSYDSNIRLW